MNKTEAISAAKQLHETEILTKKGTDLLVGYIQEDDLNFSPWRFPETYHSYKIGILAFLEEAFTVDFDYRNLSKERKEYINQKLQGQMYQAMSSLEDNRLSPLEAILKQQEFIQAQQEQTQKYHLDFDKTKENYEAYQIEAIIIDEEQLPKNIAFHIANLASLNTRQWIETTATIHPNRSVMGKQLSKTWNQLFQLNLVSQQVYDSILLRIKQREIYTEGLLLSKAIQEIYRIHHE